MITRAINDLTKSREFDLNEIETMRRMNLRVAISTRDGVAKRNRMNRFVTSLTPSIGYTTVNEH